jgi:putative transposase
MDKETILRAKENKCSLFSCQKEIRMGQATRTTKLEIDLGKRRQGGTNQSKRTCLEATAALLNRARAFYIEFFLAHAEKLTERVSSFSERHWEQRERMINADELLTWAECQTVETRDHPEPLPDWNFSQAFPDMPFIYRRSVIKDAIGKVRSYRSNFQNWQASGRKKGKPGLPGASDHPTLYKGAFALDAEHLDQQGAFVKLKVYTGTQWRWVNFPVKYSRFHQTRLQEAAWEQQSPSLILRPRYAALHIPQVKAITAKKVQESKLDPDLVTVAVDLNIKNLAVITVRQQERIIETAFVRDQGLDQQRYRHLKRISKKQWQSGRPVKGEHSCRQLWQHVRRTNQDMAHKVAHAIAEICRAYPGCVLVFERLRKIKPGTGSRSHRLNRRLANQIRGLIRDYARQQAFRHGTVTVEVNPHGTSQYCSRCGAKGERFSFRGSHRVHGSGGKLFLCPRCHYKANADFNASVNVHRSFYREYHWKPIPRPPGRGGRTP